MAMNTVNIWDGALKNLIDATGVGGITYVGEAVPGTATSAGGYANRAAARGVMELHRCIPLAAADLCAAQAA